MPAWPCGNPISITCRGALVPDPADTPTPPRGGGRLRAFSGGFLRDPVLRRILAGAGHPVSAGWPRNGDGVAVWGRRRVAWRGRAVARIAGAQVVTVEDAFLRSVLPGRAVRGRWGAAQSTGREPPQGLLIDSRGVHFDHRAPSDLETLLASGACERPDLLARARRGIDRLRDLRLSKYNAFPPDAPRPEPGYVLVIDQTRGDASLIAGGFGPETFAAMLAAAMSENPGERIVIRTHPETRAGLRSGHFRRVGSGPTARVVVPGAHGAAPGGDGPEKAGPGPSPGLRLSDDGQGDTWQRVEIWDAPTDPWTMLDGARAVYCVSSQMGFEAILAGHRPHVFGGPFYAGWGLSHDRMDFPRRARARAAAGVGASPTVPAATRSASAPRRDDAPATPRMVDGCPGALGVEALFAGAMLLYPHWADPGTGEAVTFEDAVEMLAARRRAWVEDRTGQVAAGMRLWKRAPLRRFLAGPVRFRDPLPAARAEAAASGRRVLVWGQPTPLAEAAGTAARGAGAQAAVPGNGRAAMRRPAGMGAPEDTAGDLRDDGASNAQDDAPDQGPPADATARHFSGGELAETARPPALAPRSRPAGDPMPPLVRVEDGFLRSRGLGADLVPPMSLCFDTRGIYYDPTRPSDLEALISRAAALPEAELDRARALAARLVADGVTKYNLGTGWQPGAGASGRQVVVVPGQVEDDASIRLGCPGGAPGGASEGAPGVATNLGLLQAVRAARPEAWIVYKPHPDVEAGLRPGAVPAEALAGLADEVASGADPATILGRADELWTLTSLMGFEALLRGVPVTCLGLPFYAGWGLTTDLAQMPQDLRVALRARRAARPSVAALVQAVLIDYPRYFDPLAGVATTPEVIARRLAAGAPPRRSAANRLLAKAQGLLASHAYLWRG